MTNNLNLLEHEVKTTSVRLNYLRKTNERKRINRQFTSKSKAVYRSFLNTNTTAKENPTREDLDPYWTNLWEKTNLNNDAPWIKSLQNENCSSVIQDNNCSIITAVLEKAITRLQDNKSNGSDLTVGYWYRHLNFYIKALTTLLSKTLNDNIEIPDWLTKAKTVLLPKNNDIRNPKNHSPMALQNVI